MAVVGIVALAVVGVVVVAALVLTLRSIPDVARYLRLRKM
ncbi:MAG: DUF6893 family small protein [Acidimicrobiales bacterium]